MNNKLFVALLVFSLFSLFITPSHSSILSKLLNLNNNTDDYWHLNANVWSKKRPITTKSRELFHRLKKYDYSNVTHNQLHFIDQQILPIYPDNTILELDAFGKHFRLWLRKNKELFHANFTTLHRGRDEDPSEDIYKKYHRHDYCHYHGQVTNDDGSKTTVALSMCQGRGIRGWFYAFNTRWVIRPAKWLTNKDIKKHLINDEHIIYRYDDIDTSDYPHLKDENKKLGAGCGHDHEITKLLQKKSKNHPSMDELNEIVNDEQGIMNARRSLLATQKEQEKRDKKSVIKENNELKTRKETTNADKVWPLNSHAHKQRRKLQSSTTTRYVELLIVNDPGMATDYKDDSGTDWYDDLVDDTVDAINTLQTYYLDTDWGTTVGTIQIVLTTIEVWEKWNGSIAQYKPRVLYNYDFDSDGTYLVDGTDPSQYCSSCGGDNDYYEVDYSDYLSNFHSYRTSSIAPSHDNAHLFSHYDFYSSVIGYASLPGMAIKSYSGGIEQATYDNEYNGNIIAHEMGHNWGMQHDGTGNTCDKEDYIMASVGSPYSYRPDSFSSCSLTYCTSFCTSYSSTLSALNNIPYETQYAVCGNGFVEQGESCDCGADDCTTIDSCCDGSLCALFADAECSNDDACCENCGFTANGTVCNALDSTNSCDIKAETCTGISSECPTDTYYNEGTECTPPSSTSYIGRCYAGDCISASEQCSTYTSNVQTWCKVAWNATKQNYSTDSTCGVVKCSPSLVSSTCSTYSSSVYWEDGTPCKTVLNQSDSIQQQCYDGDCYNSNTIYVYDWIAGSWGTCSQDCVNTTGVIGYQNRTVSCAYMNGTVTSNRTLCDDDSEPISSRECNNFVCDFCRTTTLGGTICGDHGDCSKTKSICICENGYSGEYCTISPGLTLIGITGRVIKNADGTTTTYRVDPYGVMSITNDSASKTTIIPLTGVWNISSLTIKDTLYVRWNSSGDLEYLAVGLVKVTSQGGWIENEWPFYVGDSLATDKQTCDENWLLNDTSCDDFLFTITDDIDPGYYRLLVRFNNEYTEFSDVLTIRCSNISCNSSGYGTCSSEFGSCNCSNNYYGNSCDEYNCSLWDFRATGSDAYADSIYWDKCINAPNGCDATAINVEDLCTCGIHYEGTYCEVPIDGCSTYSTSLTCGADSYCEWNSGKCVYKTCLSYTENECGFAYNYTNYTNYINNYALDTADSETWECEWDSSNNICIRKSCPNLAECQNGALRVPMYSFTSICDNWYCDCDTVTTTDAYWQSASVNDLLSDLNNTDLYTCAQCDLVCENGADVDDECTNCDSDCPSTWEGSECNVLYWIGNFKINVDSDLARGVLLITFDELVRQDLAYLLSTTTDKIELWQIKPSDGSSSVIVYFKYIFDTDTEYQAQLLGGDIMQAMISYVKTNTSKAYRGLIMNNTDDAYAYKYCLPYNEECDPDNQVSIWWIFYVCLGASFIFEILAILLYRFFTRNKRRKRYEEKVKEVRAAQLKLMEAHDKAKRVGMRPVSKSRARQISKAKHDEHGKQEKELKDRIVHEQNERRASAAHEQNRSEIEFNASANAHSSPGGFGNHLAIDRQVEGGAGGSAGAGTFDPHANLPPEYRVYFNDQNIPYYYNVRTGETSWRHPSNP